MDLAVYTYLIGFLNFHGLLTVHLNQFARERVEYEEFVNQKFYEIIQGEQWNIEKNL